HFNALLNALLQLRANPQRTQTKIAVGDAELRGNALAQVDLRAFIFRVILLDDLTRVRRQFAQANFQTVMQTLRHFNVLTMLDEPRQRWSLQIFVMNVIHDAEKVDRRITNISRLNIGNAARNAI